jgi:hypothetical protein
MVKNAKGEVVEVLRAVGDGYWKCDDGWTHPEETLQPTTFDERQHKMHEDQRRDALVYAFFKQNPELFTPRDK